MKFNEKINLLLKEYVSKEMVSLKKYMNMTEDDKIKDLVKRYSHFLKFYIEENKLANEVEHLTGFNIDINLATYHTSTYKIKDYKNNINILMLKLKESEAGNTLLYNFGKWLYKKITDDTVDSLAVYNSELSNLNQQQFDETEVPTWMYLKNISLIKNQWLIHFTNADPKKLVKTGFSIGVSDVNKLGLTTMLKDVEKVNGGYNFAFTLEDFNKYGVGEKNGELYYIYGKNAVLFRASGYRFWHNTDGQFQVIFYGRTAKNIIPIESMTHSHKDVNWFVKNKNTNDILFQALDLSDVTDWIQTNYQQYKDVL